MIMHAIKLNVNTYNQKITNYNVMSVYLSLIHYQVRLEHNVT